MIFAIDFDGTCVTHAYPDVGKDIMAARVLNQLSRHHRLILWTMRSGKELDDAVAWFTNNGIPLFGINSNPEQSSWTSSQKAYAHHYIDDAAIGCPLVRPAGERPYVDWVAMKQMLEDAGHIRTSG
jgi:hypothetical protein